MNLRVIGAGKDYEQAANMAKVVPLTKTYFLPINAAVQVEGDPSYEVVLEFLIQKLMAEDDWLKVYGLHPLTWNLVYDFAKALAEKLKEAQDKYGYSDGWRESNWMDECRKHLIEHVRKGDPRDVAAYCAFLWHHGEKTALPETDSQKIKVTVIEAEDGAPHVGGYIGGSAPSGEAIIQFNMELVAMAYLDEEHRVEAMRHTFKEVLVHELLHAVEDLCGLACSEERVEAVMEAARRKMAMDPQAGVVEKTHEQVNGELRDEIQRLQAENEELRAKVESNEFWREVLGEATDREQIEKELHDFHVLIEMVPEVYGHVTGNRISKPMTHARHVIAEHDECRMRDIEEAIKEHDEITGYLENLLLEVVAWGEEQFPHATAHSVSKHLTIEAAELHAAPNDVEEMADCIFLIAHLIHRFGPGLEEFKGVMRAKLEKNKARKWGAPDADGVSFHEAEES